MTIKLNNYNYKSSSGYNVSYYSGVEVEISAGQKMPSSRIPDTQWDGISKRGWKNSGNLIN